MTREDMLAWAILLQVRYGIRWPVEETLELEVE